MRWTSGSAKNEGVVCAIAIGPSVSCVIRLGGLALNRIGHVSCSGGLPKKGNVGISHVLGRLSIRGATLNFLNKFANEFIRRSLRGINLDADFARVGRSAHVGIGVGTRRRARVGNHNPIVSRRRLIRFGGRFRGLRGNSIIVFTNDLTPGLSSSFCTRLVSIVHRGNTSFIVSAANRDLVGALRGGPLIIGPGGRRLTSLFRIRLGSVSSITGCNGRLLRLNTRRILVSVTNSNNVVVAGSGICHSCTPGNAIVGSINTNSSVVNKFAKAFTEANSILRTFHCNLTYNSTATFSRSLTSGGGVGRVLPLVGVRRCGWKKGVS